jgi:hypothetical protein
MLQIFMEYKSLAAKKGCGELQTNLHKLQSQLSSSGGGSESARRSNRIKPPPLSSRTIFCRREIARALRRSALIRDHRRRRRDRVGPLHHRQRGIVEEWMSRRTLDAVADDMAAPVEREGNASLADRRPAAPG